MLANLPFTLIVMMPISKRLADAPPEEALAGTRRLLGRWGGLHAIRSLLGSAATAWFLAATNA